MNIRKNVEKIKRLLFFWSARFETVLQDKNSMPEHRFENRIAFWQSDSHASEWQFERGPTAPRWKSLRVEKRDETGIRSRLHCDSLAASLELTRNYAITSVRLATEMRHCPRENDRPLIPQLSITRV